jgi:autotransporter-associated beta strand protein
MSKNPSLLASLILLSLASSAFAQLPAFPGAEGFGSIATGGRGGDVYYVTNRNDSGAGSFAYGVQNAPVAGRTIIFAVSGHIRLPSGSGGGLTISKDKITVAGQTAPGDGICFWNNTMNLTGDDLVFRNIRWRYGYSAAGGDSVDISASQRIIFDHCDLMFGTDENMSSFGTAPEHLTFQWSTNAWGLYGHSCGGLWKTQHATVHNTLWANNHTRNPKLIGCDVFDWVNNLTFGWDNGFNMAQEFSGGTGTTYRVNIRNSSFVHGGTTSSAIYGGGTNDDGSTKFKLHMSDAALDGNNNGILDVSRTNYQLVSSGTTYSQTTTAWPQTTDGNPANPVVGVQVNAVPRLTAYKKILSQVGATRMETGSRPLRDEITQLLADKTAALQRTPISNPLELGLSTGTAFASLQSTTAPTDTDLDGMPDDWEDAVGYDKAAANNNTVLTAPETAASFFPAGSPAGYTQLEEYLHFKAVPHGTVGKNTAASPSFIDIDLRKFTSGFTASPAFTVSNITNGSITQSGPGNAIVRFTPPLETSGRAGFNFTVTDSAGDTWTQQCCLLVSTQPLPRPVTWVGDGITNNWDTTAANFISLLGPTAFSSNDAVTINDTGSNSPTIKVVGALAPASLTVNNSSKNFTIQGTGSLAGTDRFTKSGTGTLTISNTGPNTFTGSTLEAGTLSLTTANALGSTPITFNAGTLAFSADQSNALVIDGTVAINPSGSRTMNGAWSGLGTINLTNTGSNLLTLGGSMASFTGDLSLGTSTGSVRLFGNTGSATTAFDLGSNNLRLYTRNGGSSFQLGSLTGGTNTTLSGADSASTLTTYSIGALNTSTSFAGRITNGGAGPTALTKTGAGTLTLTGNSSHTGTTAINTGSLALLGTLGTSPVTVAANAALSGTGTMGGSLTTAAGGVIAPGANNGASPGTLTTASLNLVSSTLNFDLSNNPAGTNDSIVVSGGGAISLTGNLNFIFNLTNGDLGPGTYDLITTTGTLTATGVSLTSNLPTGTRQTLTLEHSPTGAAPGYVRLVVSGNNANLTWTGSNGGLWDQQTTAAWSGASPATFFNFDNVTFDDSAINGTVAIKQPVAPQSLTVNNTAASPYTFAGAPITGSTSLVKSGSGSLTLDIPQYTLANCSITASSPAVTVTSTANLLPGMTVIGTGIPAETRIASITTATILTLSQNATATSATASLTFETRNSYSGGTFLNGGTVFLTSNATQTTGTIPAPANPYGLGTGPITFNGGTLTLHGHTGGSGYLDILYGPLPNALIVPAGQTGNLNLTTRGSNTIPYPALTGTLTGSGTLNFTPNYYRASITGDWSAFSGILNVKRPVSGVSDPRIQMAAETGLPLATVNLEQVRLEYTATPPTAGAVVNIGSLSGISTSVISGSQNASGSVTWRVGSLNTSTTFAGNFTPYNSYPIGLAKTGSGIWTLTGTGTVSAGITVEQGTLSYGDAAADTLSGTSEIAVNSTATLQLNNAAKIIGSTCEIFTGGTLRGLGTLQAPLNSSGTLSITAGTFNIIGNTYLGGTLELPAFTDRLNITGDLNLDALLAFPATGLSFGRKPLINFTGNLTLGNVTFPTLPAAYLPVLDTSVAGEIAVLLIDNAAYQAWQAVKWPGVTDPAIIGPDADPDGDGMTNLEEYQAGTDPTNPTSTIPLVWQGSGSNLWDLATTANWLENATSRVFRDKRNVSIDDTGSNSPSIALTGSLQPGSLTVSNSTKAFTLSGAGSLDGPTGLTKSGTNTLTLTTSNSYSGPTAINAGAVNIQDNTALGSATGSTTVANNARLELQGNITVTGETLTISGQGGSSFYNGALNSKSGTNTWAGPVILAATGTRVGSQAGATLAITGPITSGPGSTGLTVRPDDMTATVLLSGPNTYAGDTSIVGGVLRLGASNTLPVGTSIKCGLSGVSGKLDLAGFNQEINSLAVISGTSNEITSASSATLTVNATTDSTFAAPIKGSAALTKSGSATLALTTASTYTGPTTVNAGKLLLDLSALTTPTDLLNPVSPLTLGGGTLEIKGKPATTSTQTLGNLTVPAGASATITISPNTSTSTNLTLGDNWTLGSGATLLIDLSAGNCAVFSNPALTGWLLPGVSVKDAIATGPATVVAGQVVRYDPPALTTSTNDSTREFSSLNSVFPGGTLTWTDGGLLTNRAVHRLILDTTNTGGTIDMGASTNVLTLTSGEIQFFGPNNLALTGGQLGATGSAISLTTSGTSTLTLASPISGGAGSLAISGTANVILNSASTFTGGLTLNGGNLKQGVANALGSANGTLTLNSGILDLNGIATGLGTLTGLGGSITSPTAATLTLENNNATGGNFAGSISGSIALTKTGSGTQILSGNNPYTGLTTVSAGTLRSGADNAIGNGDLTLNGGTLDLQTFSDTVAALTLTSGSITGTSGLLTASSYALTTGSISARIGGASATVAKSGATYTNSATLSGANTYGGATTLGTNSGSLVISHNSALGNSPAVDVTGTGGTALVLADGITVTGKPITIRGTGANNGSAGSFGGSLTTSSSATATWTGSITLGDSNARLGTGNSGTLTVSGPILGSGINQSFSLSSGSGSTLGTVVLSGANDFTGNISIVRGNLKLGAANTLPATAIIDVGSANIADNTTFDLNGFPQTLAGLKRTSTNTTQVSTVTNSSATAATLTLNQASNLAYSGILTGNLTLAKSGAGTLTLSSSSALASTLSLMLDAGAISLSAAHTITALRINGVWQPAGTYTSANSSGRIAGTGSLIVTTAGPSGFGTWIDTFPGLSAAQKLPDADPDLDGVNNLLEYVLNGIPNIANPAILPTPSLTPTHFVFTFTRREESATTTTQIFEYGSNLGTWTPVNITAPTGAEVSLGTLSGGLRTVTVNIPRAYAPGGALFGRLKVIQP